MPLACDPASAVLPLAAAVAWLWRVYLSEDDGPDVVGLGSAEEAERLESKVKRGELAGAVVFGHEGEPSEAAADFGELGRMHGRFSTLDSVEGEAVVTSDLGVHAAASSKVLRMAVGPDGDWGRLTVGWVLGGLRRFLEGPMRLRTRSLPPIGCVRLDDFPGTAQLQVEGKDRQDGAQSRWARRFVRRARGTDSVLNVAVPAQALDDGETVPLCSRWPRAVSELRSGTEEGRVEPVYHGLLHLNPDELAKGKVEFREFAKLDSEEADERIGKAIAWQTSRIGQPSSFVAPAWGYSDGTREALDERELPHWLPAQPGPLVEGNAVRETLLDGPHGLLGLDYRPIAGLARLGLPPVIVTHGLLFDGRHLPPRPGPVDMARLMIEPDIFRLLGLRGLKWVGAGEMISALRRHALA